MLTPQQHKIYQFIQHYLTTNGYAPTLREIGHAVNIQSRGAVHAHVKALIQVGLVALNKHTKRNIQLTKKKFNNLQLPVIGKIAAGKPIIAIENIEFINFSQILNQDDRFLLEVKGDSMIEEGILNGDYIICERCETAKNNDIVIALIDTQEATLKKFYRNKNNTVTLKPANVKMQAITYAAERIVIQGRFIGLLRINGA